MSDLAEFLLARIAEDEAVARAASPGPWTSTEDGDVHGPVRADGYEQGVIDTEGGANLPDVATAAHIARWDPARVLAECEAKRNVVALHDRDHECSTIDHTGEVDNCTWVLRGDYCTTLRLLALPYADQAAYDERWRP